MLLFVVIRVGYVRWIDVHDSTWGPFDAAHRTRALQNVGLVLSLCTRLLLDPRTWGLFWPAFFVAGGLMLAWKQTRPALLALAIAATIAGDEALFLFTNWDIAVHIDGAYTRLLAQLAPAAAVVIGAAAEPYLVAVPRESGVSEETYTARADRPLERGRSAEASMEQRAPQLPPAPGRRSTASRSPRVSASSRSAADAGTCSPR